jgi:hypothetical protein
LSTAWRAALAESASVVGVGTVALSAAAVGRRPWLVRCLALYAVIAWRIVYATMLARALPDAPCRAVLADDEWQAL